MNRDRKILLIILFFSLLISFSVINTITLNDRSQRATRTISNLEQQYKKLNTSSVEIASESLNTLEMALKEERSKYIESTEADPYKLGLQVLSMLEKRGIIVDQYKTLEQDNGFLLEFTIESSAWRFFSFWDDLNITGLYYKVPLFSIKNRKEGISAIFRIGYATYE